VLFFFGLFFFLFVFFAFLLPLKFFFKNKHTLMDLHPEMSIHHKNVCRLRCSHLRYYELDQNFVSWFDSCIHWVFYSGTPLTNIWFIEIISEDDQCKIKKPLPFEWFYLRRRCSHRSIWISCQSIQMVGVQNFWNVQTCCGIHFEMATR
jgi:hypothetical protein